MSMFMIIIQIVNCIIKYTIVQFPFIINVLGMIWGPIIITLIGCTSIYSVYMLIVVKMCTREK